MDTLSGLKILSSGMDLEADGEGACRPKIQGRRLAEIPITQAQLPNGKRIKLLKALLSSACERNCYYCPFRAGRDMPRVTFSPDEMANSFMAMYRSGLVEGIFLSSGIIGGGIRTQDLLLATAERLRRKHHFHGYLHLKIMPGVEKDQVLEAMKYASRISVNLEAPNTRRLRTLAPRKTFTEELLEPLLWAEQIRSSQEAGQAWRGRWPSTVTQFVVGAAGESDAELLQTSAYLYRVARIGRAYYSRFKPIEDTPFEHKPPETEIRERRLYQASFLVRDYGYGMEELPFDPNGNLPVQTDPKLAWAQHHLSHKPVELNEASRHDMIRVPGIGPKGASRILHQRRKHPFKEIGQLKALGVDIARAAPFILLSGRQPAIQLSFFPPEAWDTI